MSILLASRQKVLNTHEAIPIPMPQLDDSDVMIWSLEADFLAVYEDARETASGTRHDLASCIWSSRYSMCQQGLATESLGSSCLSLLFFGNLSRQSRFVTSSFLNFPSWNALSICALGSGWFYQQLPILNSESPWPMIRLICSSKSSLVAEYVYTLHRVDTNFEVLMYSFVPTSIPVRRCLPLKPMLTFQFHCWTSSVFFRLSMNYYHITRNL